MKFLQSQFLFESKKEYSPKNLIVEICVGMLLINNEFLDNLLDRGIKARYSENSSVFITDLKNLLLAKNRLNIGKFVDGKCEIDPELSKVNFYFSQVKFSIEDDWNDLINSRIISRNIIDKLIPDEKISSERISNIFWIGPNKIEDHQEDIVIELTDGRQFSIFLNKNLFSQKTSSFNTFADDLIGNQVELLYQGNMENWNKLTQSWVRIVYENSQKNIQRHIEKFIDYQNINSIEYFQYFEIKHRDPRFSNLGENMIEFQKNILKFSDLMNGIWKNRETHLVDSKKAEKEWNDSKKIILNSKILENLLSSSLKKNNSNEVKRLESGFKHCVGVVKMKLVKTIVNKMGCLEHPMYILSNNGNVFHQIPNRNFFKQNYNSLKVLFDYHVKFDEDESDFKIKIRIFLKENLIIPMDIIVSFSGGEFSSKLNAKYRFDLPDNFNYLISKATSSEE